jgi:hypothetical protein
MAAGTNERLIMARLIYSTITSLDGYVADENGTSNGPRRMPKCIPS